MNLVVVATADCRVSAGQYVALVTYGLGSCIAVGVHDWKARIGGLLHLLLPDSGIDPAKAEQNPFVFADSGIPLLIRSMLEQGAEKKRLSVRIAGGASILHDGDLFNIGKRNFLAVRKALWRLGLLIDAEDVGGAECRTVRLEVSTGRLLVKRSSTDEQELVHSPGSAKRMEWDSVFS